ncbi:MAG: acyltransferase, partial [Acidimicrobiia bacterium]|nr:acyltransferase [Acidimicrobiia bacterium]
EALKAAANGICMLVVLPAVCSYRVRALALGADRALLGSTQWLGLLPGLTGQYLRRAFLRQVLAYCAPTAVIEHGTQFSDPGTWLGDHVYVGPGCHIGLARIEREVLLAPSVHVPSGATIHGTEDPDQPLRLQPGIRRCIRIGANSWVGAGAVIMADVGDASIIGAGSVLTRALPPRVVAAGVPARVIRERTSTSGRG